MDWRSDKGKSRLIRELMAKGLSVRKAEKAVNAVFDCMARAVRRGETAEIPGGRIQAKMRKGQPRVKVQRFVNVHTGKIMFKMVSFRGPRRVIQFKPDLRLDLTPPPAPVPANTSEQAEARQLAAELLGKPVDQATMDRLQRAVEVHPHKPGALLRRLRQLKPEASLTATPSNWPMISADCTTFDVSVSADRFAAPRGSGKCR